MSSHLQGRDTAGCPQQNRAGFAGGWAVPTELCPLPCCPEPGVPPTGTPSLLQVSPRPCVCKSWHSLPSLPLCSRSRSHRPGWNVRHPINPSHTQPPQLSTQAARAPNRPFLSAELFHVLFLWLFIACPGQKREVKQEPPTARGGFNVGGICM